MRICDRCKDPQSKDVNSANINNTPQDLCSKCAQDVAAIISLWLKGYEVDCRPANAASRESLILAAQAMFGWLTNYPPTAPAHDPGIPCGPEAGCDMSCMDHAAYAEQAAQWRKLLL